jgi:hypothetical protein
MGTADAGRRHPGSFRPRHTFAAGPVVSGFPISDYVFE